MAGSLGLEAEPVDVSYAEVARLVWSAGPALLRLPGAGEPHFLALLSGRRRAVSILGPDRRLHRLRPDVICRALCHELEQLHIARVDQLLGEAKVPKRRQARARVAILHERLSPVRLHDAWLLRLPPGASICASNARHACRVTSLYSFVPMLSSTSCCYSPGGWWVARLSKVDSTRGGSSPGR